MKRAVDINELATGDIREAWVFFEGRSNGFGDQFLRRIEQAEDILSEQAEAFPLVYRNVRRYVMDQFPYLILYRIVGASVVIFAVVDGRRNPRRWRARARQSE